MIKFFRHIRRSLILKNQMGKYLKYAIGEIILVVIGILIALQINNWNENNKKNQLKQEYINALINDLTKDTIQLQKSITYNKNRLIANTEVLDSISSGYYKNLNKFIIAGRKQNGILSTTNTYNTNSFNLLIAGGNIDMFRDKLRTELMELNKLQNSERHVIQNNTQAVVGYLGYINKKYPMMGIPISMNETEALIWKNVPIDDIPRDVANFLIQEQMLINGYLNLTEQVLKQTEYVLELLKHPND